MSEKLIEKLTEWVSRRSVLAGISTATAAMVTSLFDVTRASDPVVVCGSNTIKFACCCLFFSPSGPACTDCACEWCWTCEKNNPFECQIWTCYECYSAGPCSGTSPCGGVGTNAKCSRAFYKTVTCRRF